MADNIVKAEYLKAIDEDTNTEVLTQFIPPEPLGTDRGGITQEEYEKLLNSASKDSVSALKKDKVDKPLATDDGKIPRAKSGGVEWVDVGQPTDEQTISAVSDWLNEHPEVTTTVDFRIVSKIYDTYDAMMKDVFSVMGEKCMTLGYHSKNDGGGAYYEIVNGTPKILQNGNVYNVCQYGILPNMNKPISDALTELLSKIPDESTLYFPAGEYLFNNTLVVSKNVKIIGELSSEYVSYDYATNQTVFKVTSDFPENEWMIIVNENKRFVAEQISFKGNKSYYQKFNDGQVLSYETTVIKVVNGIKFNGGFHRVVKNCNFVGFGGVALELGIYDCSFYNKYFTCYMGEKIATDDYSTGNRYQNCYVGVEVIGSLNTLSDLRFDGIATYGLHFAKGVANAVVSNLAFDQIYYASIFYESYSSSCFSNIILGRCCQANTDDANVFDANDLTTYAKCFPLAIQTDFSVQFFGKVTKYTRLSDNSASKGSNNHVVAISGYGRHQLKFLAENFENIDTVDAFADMVYSNNSSHSVISFGDNEFSLNGMYKNYKRPLSINNVVVNRELSGYGGIIGGEIRVGAIYVGRDKISIACGTNTEDVIDIKTFN